VIEEWSGVWFLLYKSNALVAPGRVSIIQPELFVMLPKVVVSWLSNEFGTK